jgi:hypothetical protein
MSVNKFEVIRFEISQSDWSALFVPHGAKFVEVLSLVDNGAGQFWRGELLWENPLGSSLDLVDLTPEVPVENGGWGPVVLADKWYMLFTEQAEGLLPKLPGAELVGRLEYGVNPPPNPEPSSVTPLFLAKAGPTILFDGGNSGLAYREIPFNTIYTTPIVPPEDPEDPPEDPEDPPLG